VNENPTKTSAETKSAAEAKDSARPSTAGDAPASTRLDAEVLLNAAPPRKTDAPPSPKNETKTDRPQPDEQNQTQNDTIGSRPGQNGPAFEHRALEVEYRPGVFDPTRALRGKENAIATRLAQEGWRIDARPADHTIRKPNPDTMVRKSADDPGVITEFKTLESTSPNALKRNINDASKQVPENGEVVIDGRGVGTTREDAEQAFSRAVGQPGRTVAKKVHIILADNTISTFERVSKHGTT
jgi:hypothetical protein